MKELIYNFASHYTIRETIEDGQYPHTGYCSLKIIHVPFDGSSFLFQARGKELEGWAMLESIPNDSIIIVAPEVKQYLNSTEVILQKDLDELIFRKGFTFVSPIKPQLDYVSKINSCVGLEI